jgi:hypothetical protein
MARQPVITRTITTTKVEMLAVDIDSKSTVSVEVTLPRTYKDEQAMLKMANKRNVNPAIKFVAVIGTPIVESKRWGMTEQELIDMGYEFPPYKVKADTDDVETVEA